MQDFSDLDKKVRRALALIRSASEMAARIDQPLEVCYSGGKDSDVILALTRMAGVPHRAIYKNTTIDPPGTAKHAREVGAEVLMPKKSFLQLVKSGGFPTRRARFCCSELKEYKVLDYAIVGVRRAESTARAKRYHEPEQCRVYSKTEKVRQYFPILDWSDDDVAAFVRHYKIKCHPLYYDEQGNFHVERRLGCIGCPLQADNGKAGFKQYPKLLRSVIRGGKFGWTRTRKQKVA